MRLVYVPLVLLVAPLPTFAAEGEQGLSVSGGYANLTLPQSDASDGELAFHGGMVQLDYERGLSNTFWVRGAVSGGLYDGPVSLAYSGAATVDLVYRFDFFRYVPYFVGGLGLVTGFGDGVETRYAPVVELGGGLEVLESREFSWGLEIKADAFPSQARYLTVAAKASWRWGFF